MAQKMGYKDNVSTNVNMTESDVKHHNPHLTFVIYISEIRRS
jgi:hypothetical protein